MCDVTFYVDKKMLASVKKRRHGINCTSANFCDYLYSPSLQSMDSDVESDMVSTSSASCSDIEVTQNCPTSSSDRKSSAKSKAAKTNKITERKFRMAWLSQPEFKGENYLSRLNHGKHCIFSISVFLKFNTYT